MCATPLLAAAGAPSPSLVGPFLRAAVDPPADDGELRLHGEGTTALVSRPRHSSLAPARRPRLLPARLWCSSSSPGTGAPSILGATATGLCLARARGREAAVEEV
jgi:hypothetical protein